MEVRLKKSNSRFVGPCPNCAYDRYEHALSLHKSGYSVIEISEIMGVPKERVRIYLGHIPPHELGIVRKNSKLNPKDKEIKDLYLQGLSQTKIKQLLNVSQGVITNSVYGLKPFERDWERSSTGVATRKKERRETMADKDEFLIGKPDQPIKRGPGRPPNASKASSMPAAASLQIEKGKRVSSDDDDDEPEEEGIGLQIEKNVPMPNDTGARGVGQYIPLDRMEVEDSVLVPYGYMGIKEEKVLLSRIRNKCSDRKKKTNRRFIVKATNKGIRIWRAE